MLIIAEESRTHTPCGENFSRLLPNLISQDAYLASTRFDKIHQKIQRRRVLRSFARANIWQMQRENAKQYKILRAFCLPQVQIFAAQNRMSSALFGYSTAGPQCKAFFAFCSCAPPLWVSFYITIQIHFYSHNYNIFSSFFQQKITKISSHISNFMNFFRTVDKP